MTSPSLYASLGWLPPAPDDFMMRCRSLSNGESQPGRGIHALASCSLDENQLNRLSKTIRAARGAGQSLEPLTPFRLGVLSNATLDFIPPAVTASAARHGI